MPSMVVLVATMVGTAAGVSRPHSKGGFKPLSHVGRRHFQDRSPSHGPGRACFPMRGKGEEEKQRDRGCCRAPKSSHYSPVPFASMRVRMSAQWQGCKNVAGEDLFQSSRTYRTGYLDL